MIVVGTKSAMVVTKEFQSMLSDVPVFSFIYLKI